MNAPTPNPIKENLDLPIVQMGDDTILVHKIFKVVNCVIVAGAIAFFAYFLLASDRYVSTATIQVHNTDQVASSGLDFSALRGASSTGVTIPDQLLLKEHLLSLDMLKKLDDSLDLRSHFSSSDNDIASRMWFKDASLEWFFRHFLSRVSVDYDEFTGVLRISSEAYTPEMAKALTAGLVREGERYMNEMSHELAREQVHFLETQVEAAQAQVKRAREELIAFQNSKGLSSAAATADGMRKLIAKLEEQRAQLQTRLASLPANLDKGHATRKSLVQSLQAVQKQIDAEQKKLASTSGDALNSLMSEETRLSEEVAMKQDVYKNALICLEKGRMDAARTLKLVAVLQSPSHPEYAWHPRRIYGITVTFLLTLVALGIANMLKAIILDHVD
ncbi:MAG: hypothetical protein K2H64_08560 [Desulfovibrio sp.]|nr:hypothetical protein [Desulfovibrio sp.]